MSVNTGKLGDGTKCARVRKAGAVLDKQRADLSPSQTLLIKAGNVCNLSSLTLLAVFLCCLLLHLNALFCLCCWPFFPPLPLFFPYWKCLLYHLCVRVSLYLLCMVCRKILSLRASDSSKGILKQYLFKQ